ncbi:hypothetical protein XJ32_02800 [Helicobacter bilis]|uniref:Uncharacterized protein n=1 Tax=Helicobacter bilis TaxID=37372 RepID=A0A1Q2LFL8_9HELI|nr:hypothetical protein [Helicobacter bilis]AQQ59208.1 hypothetical protein XJ32_02800 [Helicobacter bilis]
MSKNIQTHNANINLIKKFLDYANCADASYASSKYALYFIFGIFVIALLNGCSFSFKYIDPQYYEFKRLCKKAEDEVTIYNEDYWEIIEKHSDIETNDRGCFYSQKLKQEICFGNFNYKSCTEYKRGSLSKLSIKRYYNNIHYATQIEYNYKYFGLYLKGDEAAGWHWKTSNILICEDLKNEKRH